MYSVAKTFPAIMLGPSTMLFPSTFSPDDQPLLPHSSERMQPQSQCGSMEVLAQFACGGRIHAAAGLSRSIIPPSGYSTGRR
jgi:hypothetical protein